MLRLGAVFVAGCMLVISGSLSAVLYLLLGFTGPEAMIAGVAALSTVSLINAVTTRVSDTSATSGQIADLSRGTADLARQVGELARRVGAVETDLGRTAARAMAATDPLAAELGVLGSLVKQLADSVAAHETALIESARAAQAGPPPARRAAATPAQPAAAPPPPPPVAPSMPAASPSMPAASLAAEPSRLAAHAPLAAHGAAAGPQPAHAPAASEPAAATPPREAPTAERREAEAGAVPPLGREEMLGQLRRAIDGNRIDLYLQPIVTLPQRKVRFYEAMTRLRGDNGELLLPADFTAVAEDGQLMPAIDNLLLFRCVQVVRRLQTKNREIGLFCNMSASTLNHSAIFAQVSDFLDANRALASAIVLEFSQDDVRAMGPIEHESLAALADLGFRFSMDRMTDLHLDPREFADRGFRFVKAPATLLLGRPGTASDIHPADFSDLLGRFGIELIAERIESEGTVIDLLDFDVRFGQGVLFAPPRPVRSEVLQGLSDRPAVPGRSGPREEPSLRGPEPLAEPTAPERAPAERRTGSAQLAREVIRRG